jgi:hypothetical protein
MGAWYCQLVLLLNKLHIWIRLLVHKEMQFFCFLFLESIEDAKLRFAYRFVILNLTWHHFTNKNERFTNVVGTTTFF